VRGRQQGLVNGGQCRQLGVLGKVHQRSVNAGPTFKYSPWVCCGVPPVLALSGLAVKRQHKAPTALQRATHHIRVLAQQHASIPAQLGQLQQINVGLLTSVPYVCQCALGHGLLVVFDYARVAVTDPLPTVYQAYVCQGRFVCAFCHGWV
jgi:hypothetical protein